MKVSVVVPIYNAEDYLEECLECIINQSLQDMEIICVNDGSTDRTEEILADYARMDNRIIVINKRNSGYGHSVNMGIRVACGEYISIVEADDYLELEMMEELYNKAAELNLDVVKADFDIVRGGLEKRVHSRQKICKEYDFYNQVTNTRVNKDIFHASLFTWAGIYRREFLIQNGIWHNETPGASYQDNGFWFQVFVKAQSIYFVDRSYYRLRRDNPNSSIKSKQKVYCICDEYDFIRRKLLEWGEREYLPIQWYWRFKGYVGTLRRISSEYKEEFLDRFQKDFLYGREEGELELEMLKEDSGFLQSIMEGTYERIFKIMFLDQELIDKLRSDGEVVLYGDEDKVRDICKRLDQYNDVQINIVGVALTNGRTQGMVWNRNIVPLERMEGMAKTVWLAVADNGESEQMFRRMGYSKFIALPEYIEGIKNV